MAYPLPLRPRPLFCSNCRSEYVSGITFCRDCELDLVEKLPPESVVDYEYAPIVEVYRAYGHTDAQVMRSVLEGSGIDAFVGANVLASSVYRFTVGSVSEMSVCVKAPEEKRARDLVKAAQEGKLAQPEA